MFQLKPLSPASIHGALDKAERYRVLNEPLEAESICLDVLELEPTNQQALITLLLALSDQFLKLHSETFGRACALLLRLGDAYERHYYRGIVFERSAKARISRGQPGARYSAFRDYAEAMQSFEAAMALRPAGNDDAVLRWNTCARYLNRHPEVQAEPAGDREHPTLE